MYIVYGNKKPDCNICNFTVPDYENIVGIYKMFESTEKYENDFMNYTVKKIDSDF